MPDPIFADPRLARLYDTLECDRTDLDVYRRLVDEFEVRTLLDVGCGTGTFACLLARDGVEVVAVDPAVASLDIARAKPLADAVTWLLGDATTLPPLAVDMAIMTGNVAQVFLDDEEFCAALRCMSGATRAGGHMVFEVRDPAWEAWRSWTRETSISRTDVPAIGPVTSWVEVTDASLPLVTFRWTYHFERSDESITSDSTLCFRDRPQLEACVSKSGLDVVEVRDAPDRPGLEFVFVCTPRTSD